MKVDRHDGEPERSILIAMIVCTPFLAKAAPKWPQTKSLFRSEWSDIIANWCVEHFRKYQMAPGKKIVSIFHAWAEKAQNDELRKLINRLLVGLSKQYEALAKEIDVKYTTDLAETYFRDVQVDKHIDNLKASRDRGHSSKAVEEAQNYVPISLSGADFIDLLSDQEAQRLALERRQNVVVKYAGDLGIFYGEELSEESLVCYVAPMKVGKSYYMLDNGWKGLMQGHRVAYFQVGDLSQDQIIRRFHARAAYRPLKRRVVQYPICITPAQNGFAQVDFEAKPYDNDLTWAVGKKAFEKAKTKYGQDMFRLRHYPTKSISMEGIRNILLGWAQDNWRPKIVIIDYSENLAAVNTKMLPLDQVEETWALMSRVREEMRCCLITAIQAPREAFNAWVMTRKHFSKNKMIFAHATSVIGLNRTDEESKRHLMRMNFIVRREEAFSETNCCHLAECRDLCHVTVQASFNPGEVL